MTELTELAERRLVVLAQTYPSWRITPVRRPDGSQGEWIASRYTALTKAQRAAGLELTITRGSAEALVAALAAQDAIAHRTGYSL